MTLHPVFALPDLAVQKYDPEGGEAGGRGRYSKFSLTQLIRRLRLRTGNLGRRRGAGRGNPSPPPPPTPNNSNQAALHDRQDPGLGYRIEYNLTALLCRLNMKT